MTMRAYEAKYEFLDTATEEELQEMLAAPDPMTRMMNDIEATIEGHNYEDVFGALALILVNAIRECDDDPQRVLGTINLHMSAAWSMVMGDHGGMTMN
jgi:DNA replicative helicase MCM subunit Mcm2 (Cdc46/Mcm family)